jgi:hypothetical protein
MLPSAQSSDVDRPAKAKEPKMSSGPPYEEVSRSVGSVISITTAVPPRAA